MTDKIRMTATQAQRFGGKYLAPGDQILATAGEAKTLRALRRAVDAPRVAALFQPAERRDMTAVEPEPYQTRALEAEPPRAKRAYRRREVSPA
jgi:hypothetical protein